MIDERRNNSGHSVRGFSCVVDSDRQNDIDVITRQLSQKMIWQHYVIVQCLCLVGSRPLTTLDNRPIFGRSLLQYVMIKLVASLAKR